MAEEEVGAPAPAQQPAPSAPGPADGSPESGGGEESASARRQRLERLGERTEDFVETVESAIGKAVPPRLRLREAARHNTALNVMWRAGVLALGIALIGFGVLLLVLPGPGWALIILGLATLASEYTWANRLLAPVRRHARAAAAHAMRPEHRRKVIAAGVLLCLAAGAGAWWYYATYGLAVPW